MHQVKCLIPLIIILFLDSDFAPAKHRTSAIHFEFSSQVVWMQNPNARAKILRDLHNALSKGLFPYTRRAVAGFMSGDMFHHPSCAFNTK